jgi:hypothetical protein
MTFLLANWKLVLLGLLIASTAMFYKLWREEVRAFNAYKIEVAALGKAAEMEKKRIETDHAKVTKEIKNAIPKQIAAARSGAVAAYVSRMQHDASSGSVRRVAGLPEGVHEPSEKPVSVGCDERFVQDSAEDAATIIGIQSWVRGIGFPVK